jgi:hypothetical protein
VSLPRRRRDQNHSDISRHQASRANSAPPKEPTATASHFPSHTNISRHRPQLTFNPKVEGPIPSGPTNKEPVALEGVHAPTEPSVPRRPRSGLPRCSRNHALRPGLGIPSIGAHLHRRHLRRRTEPITQCCSHASAGGARRRTHTDPPDRGRRDSLSRPCFVSIMSGRVSPTSDPSRVCNLYPWGPSGGSRSLVF